MADKDYKAFIVEGEAREPQVIDNISKEIQVMLNSGDKSKMATAQGFQTQLASISGRAESIQSTQIKNVKGFRKSKAFFVILPRVIF